MSNCVSPSDTSKVYWGSIVADGSPNQAIAMPSNNANPIEYVSLLLHGDGINNAQNNAFRDSSSNDHTITPVGTVTQGSFSPFGDLWSNYFPGINSNYLSIPSNSAFNFASGTFTVEFWIYFNSVSSGTWQNIVGNYNGISTGWSIQADDKFVANFSGDVSDITGTTTLVPNTWYHVAVSGSTGSYKLFVNGVQEGSTHTGTTSFTGGILGIGALGDRPGFIGLVPVNGNISNLRIVNGTALYNSNFTPLTSNLTAIVGTVLLTCQSNTFEDNSTNNFAITVNGTPSVVPNSPFKPTIAYSPAIHGGSGYIIGSSHFRAPLASLPFTDDTWTIECWVYMSTVAANNPICCASDLMVFNLTPTQLQLAWRPAAGGWLGFTSDYTFEANNWYHVSVSRDNGVIRFSVNGVVMTATGVAVDGAQGGQSTAFFYIGAFDNFPFSGTMDNFLAGYISGFRVTNNVLYPAGFNPPTAPPTNSAATSLLLNFTNAGIFDSVRKHDIRAVDDANISTAVTKYGSGSIRFQGNNDYLTIPNSSDFAFGTGDFTVEAWVYPTGTAGYKAIFSTRSAVITTPTSFIVGLNTGNTSAFWYANGFLLVNAQNIGLNTWAHVAVSRQGTTLRLFVDGVLISTAFNNDNLTSTLGTVGANADGSEPFDGYIDDLRITKGVAVYTSNFTPPTQAFPDTFQSQSSTINVTLSSPTSNDTTTSSYFNYSGIPCTFKNADGIAARTNWEGPKTWTFSQPVTNPAFAVYSLGNGGQKLSLTTSASSWKILCNSSVSANQICISNDGTTIEGKEGYGIIVFPGTYNSITINSDMSEYYSNYVWGTVDTPLVNQTTCVECPTALPLTLEAECVSVYFPRGLRPSGGVLGGSVETANVTIKNIGTTTWTTGQLFRLGCQDPQDNSNWGTCRVSLPSALPVLPDANVTFTFPVTAPALSGTYPFSWKMLSEAAPGGLGTWFGPTCTKLVTVQNICSNPLTYTPIMSSSCNDFLNNSVYKKLSADECVGNTRSTINQNFFSIQQTLTLMRDTIPFKYKNDLNAVFREYGVSLCPSVNINMESIDSDDCLGDSRLTINNNIINIKNVIDELHFIINFFSDVPYSFSDTNELIYGLIPENECIGDSLERLNYLFDYIKNLLSEICSIVDVPAFTPTPTPTPTITPTNTPTCTNERGDILDRFALQGEGGYNWNTFNFVDRDKMYVSESFANERFPSVIGGSPAAPAAYYTTYDYTTAIGGTTYYGLSGILRFCAGNANNTAIFRDGRVFWSGSTKVHPWIQTNINQFKDLFMPSSYRANYVQLVLMKNGELRKLDLDDATEENNPPVVVGLDNTVSPAVNKTLNDVTKIVQINQAHNADCIVACADDSVWHVVVANGNYAPTGEIAARRIKNLKASEIQFAMIGDPGDSCFVVLKNDLKKIYRLNNSGRNLCDFGWLTERSLTPVNLTPFTYYGSSSTTLLEPDEYFIDGSSNEFHFTFLTNKYVHCFKAAQYGIGSCAYPGQNPVYVKHTLLPSQQPSIRMVTATSYAMAVELADGFYLLSSNGIGNYVTGEPGSEYHKAYQNMDKIPNWTNLANVLAPLRGLVPFDTSCPIIYTPPPTVPPYQPTPTPTPTATSTSTPSQTPTPSTCIPLEGEKFIDVGETLRTCNSVNRSNTNIIVKGSFWVDNTIKVKTLLVESGANLYLTGFILGSVLNDGGTITNAIPPSSATYLCCDI